MLRPKQLLKEPQEKREGTSTIRRVWHVCGGLLVGFTLPSAIDFQSRWVLDITHGTPTLLAPPQIFVGKKSAAQEIFGLEIFLEQQIFGKYCPSKILERNNS